MSADPDDLVVRWRPADAERETSTAWDSGATGVAEIGDEAIAGFSNRARAQGFAATVGGRVEAAVPWSPPPGSAVEIGDGPNARSIWIDAGATFGHGAHPTTRLVLDWMASAPLGGMTCLDIGSGSGVLSVAAAALGAEVTAIDLDPAARIATADNAAANGVTVNVVDDPLPLDDTFEVVFANMLLADQRPVAGEIAAAARDVLVVSGFLSHQATAIAELYPHFRPSNRAESDGWTMLELRRG